MKKNVLVVENLVKTYGNSSTGFTAVDNISFDMKEGEILGFLGPNGAGKTTTIQMLLGILTPTSGSITYFGKDLASHREEILEKINFSSTYTNLPWYLTVKENLTWVAHLYDIKNRKKKIEEIAQLFKLEGLMNKAIGQLSAGQQTRVNLAKSFLNSPKIMLLDEPTASLDPDIAKYIRDIIYKENEENKISVIFTSHNMAEIEEVCHRVIFVNHGRIIANDKPEKLAQKVEVSHIELLVRDGLKRAISYFEEKQIKYKSISKRTIRIDVKEKEISQVLRDIMSHGIIYDEISIDRPTLEDYFLQVAGEKI